MQSLFGHKGGANPFKPGVRVDRVEIRVNNTDKLVDVKRIALAAFKYTDNKDMNHKDIDAADQELNFEDSDALKCTRFRLALFAEEAF